MEADASWLAVTKVFAIVMTVVAVLEMAPPRMPPSSAQNPASRTDVGSARYERAPRYAIHVPSAIPATRATL